MNNVDRKSFFKCSFLYYFITSLVLGGIFISYLGDGAVAQAMDARGWAFYATATLSWAAVFALVPYLLATVVYALTRRCGAASVVQISLTVLLLAYFLVNGMIYAQYRFHINGFVLDMLFSEGAGDIFQFNASIYIKLATAFVGLVLAAMAVWKGCRFVIGKWNYAAAFPASLLLVAALLFSNGFHAYAAVVKIPSVIRSAPAVPY